MVKINWISTIILLGAILLSACNAQPDKNTPSIPTQSLSTESLSENEVIDSAKAEIRKITNQDVRVSWQTINGDRVFGVAYTTIHDPQKASEEFIAEFNQVVLISAKWFAQSNANSPIMIVFAELINSPVSQENPPLREVVVEKEKAIEWLKGNSTDNEFTDSWFVVPLPN